MIAQNAIRWEVYDNFQKQTYRNRSFICTDRGKLMLNVPIHHVGKNQGRQLYKDVRVENNCNWQRQHWRTLETAYRTSPYFEFYEDEIAPLFSEKLDFLLDFNLRSIATICDCLQIDMPGEKTESFEIQPQNIQDMRYLVNAKEKLEFEQPEYVQVFGDRHGFIENTGILDLLFNEGPNTLSYLKRLNIKPLNA